MLGEGVTAADLNDDALGSTLDAIYAYGPTELFNDFAMKVMIQLDLGVQRLHADTTITKNNFNAVNLLIAKK